MKLISLNLWGGRQYDDLLNFIKIQSETVDFFCFQETYESDRDIITPKGSHSNLNKKIAEILPDFNYYFSPNYEGRDFEFIVDFPLKQGNSIFYRKNLVPKNKGEIFPGLQYNDVREFPDSKYPNTPRNFQYLQFDDFQILNIHGYWEEAPKHDTLERFQQSEAIINFFKSSNLTGLIAGDFNLRMDNECVKQLEENGFRNLVKESGAQTTRSSFYDIKWRAIDPFADFIFSKNNIKIKDFKVLPDEISDHLPLYVEFEV